MLRLAGRRQPKPLLGAFVGFLLGHRLTPKSSHERKWPKLTGNSYYTVIGPPAKGTRLQFVEQAASLLAADSLRFVSHNPLAEPAKFKTRLASIKPCTEAGSFGCVNPTGAGRFGYVNPTKAGSFGYVNPTEVGSFGYDCIMIRLLTYNIHKGIGGRDRRCRLERIIEVIALQKPDIVCLQEVTRDARRTGRAHQPRLLAEALAMPQILYQMNVQYRQGGYGNLLLCRWGIVQEHHLCLRQQERKPRGAQLAVIDTPQGNLLVVNWHLGLSDRERLWQARRLLAHDSLPTNASLPILLAGDTNDWRGRLAKGPLAAHGFRELTAPAVRFRTFPAWLPAGALDKFFARGPIYVHEVKRVVSRQARIASDHLPLVVDFEIQ
jgi:endonuclease/exonuclease/phosphatase family metal-dependent hydrolase